MIPKDILLRAPKGKDLYRWTREHMNKRFYCCFTTWALGRFSIKFLILLVGIQQFVEKLYIGNSSTTPGA
jgi:hypothetical protein